MISGRTRTARRAMAQEPGNPMALRFLNRLSNWPLPWPAWPTSAPAPQSRSGIPAETDETPPLTARRETDRLPSGSWHR